MVLGAGNFAQAAETRPVEFNRDIRPILSENCFYCHGQDPKHREAKLRLDVAEEATRDLGGYAALVAGKPELSEVFLRLTSEDSDEVMPPADANRHVTKEQIALIKRWIAEGAKYQKHWAFEPPVRPAKAKVQDAKWARNDLDHFVLAKLDAEGLKPSQESTAEAWLRRASLDLIGLPPTPRELDEFAAEVAKNGEAAFAKAADRLLASEHFGERLAIDWLDAARYADTHGFNNDSARSMWRWRDWVIDAFNANKPYDQFITEQLAGDLLPNATIEQKIATGFGRNHVINSEGGIIEEEYRVEYVSDRVRTTSLAWLGLTMECAKCHDHKYDPITQKDYYRMFAFFNQVPEHGEDGRTANAAPILPAPTRAQSGEIERNRIALEKFDAELKPKRDAWKWQEQFKDVIDQAIAEAKKVLPEKDQILYVSCEDTEPQEKKLTFYGGKPALVDGVNGKSWSAGGVEPMAKTEPNLIKFDVKTGNTISFWIRPAADNPRDVAIWSNRDYGGVPAGGGYGRGQEIRLIDGTLDVRISQRFPAYAIRVICDDPRITPDVWQHVTMSYWGELQAKNVRIFMNGTEVPTRVVNDGYPSDAGMHTEAFLIGADRGKDGAKFRGQLDELRVFSRGVSRPEAQAVFRADALPFALSKMQTTAASAAEQSWLREAVLENTDSAWKEIAAKRAELFENDLSTKRALPTVMGMVEMPEMRPTFLLTRGQYDAHGEAVDAGVPEELLGAWPKDAPRNRLGLARWFTRPDHPLTARVVVNRFWTQLFGTGLVKTLEDFGFQGEWPSHPELLDWLAREFVDGGWDVKALFKTMVLSSTYRQSSVVTPDLVARDPENRLLARGPRVRLPAELIRDQALAISGLLRHRLGGPSVYPYQPEKLYDGVVVGANYPGTKWVTNKGDGLYRRSLYTFWKRTIPHPVMTTFDAPDREFCSVRRSRTNTPLQALVLLNETAFVESARQLATRMLSEGGADDRAKVSFGFRLSTSRLPTDAEIEVLMKKLTRMREDFTNDPKAAAELLKVGSTPADASIPAPELAAMTTIASMLLNLDETITKN